MGEFVQMNQGSNEEEKPRGTYRFQGEIPKLPVPDLKVTCGKYLECVRVLLDDAEFLATEKAVEAFLEKDGPKLHEELLAYSAERPSYLAEFWNATYTQYMGPLMINVNPIFVLEDDPTPRRHNQVERASSLLLSSFKFVKALRDETLQPDMWKKTPLCMSQFPSIFGSCRVPGSNGADEDEIVNHRNGRHIVLIRRGQFYYFEALTAENEIAVTERQIAKNLKLVVKDSDKISDEEAAASALGVLTAGDRKVWAKLRKKLISLSEVNRKTIELIDEALFVLCLDNLSPKDVQETASDILHGSYRINEKGTQVGTCISRWYDKLQLIVADNGSAGVNFEHSAVDGHTILRFTSDVFTDTIVRFAQTISGPSRVNSFMEHPQTNKAPSSPTDTTPKRLYFELDDELRKGIRFGEARASDLIQQTETEVLEFTGYGKLFIVQNGMSPDAFVQISLIMAYFNLYGCIVNVYESVQTKVFALGRTEAGRSATPQALAYCKAFQNEQISAAEKIQKLNEALRAHSNVTRAASKGQGVDRLLFSLKCLHQQQHPDQELPALFRDKGWAVLQRTILSTSNCGNPSLRFFGFGPVSENGLGIGYIIKDDSINFCVTSKHRQTNRFIKSLKAYFEDVQDLMLAVRPVSAARFWSKSVKDSEGYGFFGAESSDEDDAEEAVIGTPLFDEK